MTPEIILAANPLDSTVVASKYANIVAGAGSIKSSAVEAPKGELGILLIGDNGVFHWRYEIRPPGFIKLQILPQLVKRMKLADIMTILSSIDTIMVDVDH
ncbi:NADH-quinone oxidoreductase, subunit D [Cynara cardunculus var. scolymus]|uniref:NADH-quinone oxidoreductase, subunit D n=1 Tax=Cynara cardunculus var. scolymus TaxID=59895 RepID=A0A124SEA2_CYNCS|nr:NADH-quinone oxidoreductase, subunit D [Cynara cardunculus var. scolymus]